MELARNESYSLKKTKTGGFVRPNWRFLVPALQITFFKEKD